MDPIARIEFSDKLLDTSKSASIQIIEVAGQLKLQITLGINGKKLSSLDNPTARVKKQFRDATLYSELFIKGEGNITLEKDPTSTDETTSFLNIKLKATAKTKLPGTGPDLFFE